MRRRTDTATMTRTFTISSGAATPKTERRPCVIQGFPGTARMAANGARAIPNSEMLAAPSTKASHTRAGGPGRSSAAMTSHSTSNAGAMAATPIDVGRAWSSSMQGALLPRLNENGRKFSRLQESLTRTRCRQIGPRQPTKPGANAGVAVGISAARSPVQDAGSHIGREKSRPLIAPAGAGRLRRKPAPR